MAGGNGGRGDGATRLMVNIGHSVRLVGRVFDGDGIGFCGGASSAEIEQPRMNADFSGEGARRMWPEPILDFAKCGSSTSTYEGAICGRR